MTRGTVFRAVGLTKVYRMGEVEVQALARLEYSAATQTGDAAEQISPRTGRSAGIPL